MLPDDIIIEITKLLTIREYHRLSLTEKYFNWLLHQDICVQYYLQRHDWFRERGRAGLDLSTNLALGIVCVKDYSRL